MVYICHLTHDKLSKYNTECAWNDIPTVTNDLFPRLHNISVRGNNFDSKSTLKKRFPKGTCNKARLYGFLHYIDKTQDERIRTSRLKLQSHGRTEGLTRTEKPSLLTKLTHVPGDTPTCRGPLLCSVRHVGTLQVGVYPLIIKAWGE